MKTLVTIPGIMSDERTWDAVTYALKSKVDRVHVADIRIDATLEDMAARALAATTGDLIVLAHSMGGRVAMEMGRQAPERILAMVLSNTNADGPGAQEAAHREARIAEANADMIAYAKGWVPKVISAASRQNSALVSQIQTMVEDCPPQVQERQNRALIIRPDATTYLNAFNFPVLVATGSEDHLSTEASNGVILSLLKDAESVVIDHSGHLLPFEQPEKLGQIISQWLARKGIAA